MGTVQKYQKKRGLKEQMKSIFYIIFGCVALSTPSWAQVATVDGVGGASTGDARFPTSFANIGAALVSVTAPANDVAPGNTIRVTAPTITETAGLTFNTQQDITVESTVSGGSHIKLKESGIGISGASCAMVIVQRTDKNATFKDLIFTPTDGAGGGINARLAQVYNASVDVTNHTLTFQRCYFTAIYSSAAGANAGKPVLNPLVHAASANTNAARNSQLRSFDGGGANNLVELRHNSAPTAGNVTYNFEDCVFTHTLVAAAGAKGGGIVVSRSGYLTFNVKSCIFSFNAGSGIRTAITASAPSTMIWNISGTAARPSIFYRNGWQEDSANAARAEGLYMDAGDLTIDHAYFVNNYQDGIEKQNVGNVAISNTFSADNCFDLDTSVGTAPDAANTANLKLAFADASVETIQVTSVTLHNSVAPTNDLALLWTQSNQNSLVAKNVIYSGAGDQVSLPTDLTSTGATYNETDSALVQAGANSLESPFITVGTNITPTIAHRVTADPEYASTVFAPVWNGITSPVTGLNDYLSVRSTAYLPSREAGAANVTGANPVYSANASVEDYMLY